MSLFYAYCPTSEIIDRASLKRLFLEVITGEAGVQRDFSRTRRIGISEINDYNIVLAL